MKKPVSPFNWNTGAPSCMYTAAGERAARAMAGAGKALDAKGRAVVSMAPRSAQAISINPNSRAAADRNDSIKRGGI